MKSANTLTAWLLAGLAFTLAAAPAPAAGVLVQRPDDVDGVDTDGDGDAGNDHVHRHFGAGDGFSTMADGSIQYMFGFSDLTSVPDADAIMEGMLSGELPAPSITLREGQKAYFTLTNVGMMMRPDLFDPHSIHFHGFANAAPVFDGEPMSSFGVNMLSSLTYFYDLRDPGTYMWHCHVEAAEHMQMGMLGSLWVYPKQDQLPDDAIPGHVQGVSRYAYNDGDGTTAYDVEYPVQFTSFDPAFHLANETAQALPFANMDDRYPMINGRGYPDTVNPAPLLSPLNGKPVQAVSSIIEAEQGQRILLRCTSLVTTEHLSMTCLGIPMRVVGEGARILRGGGTPAGTDLTYLTNTLTLGGGESRDVILDTADVQPGTYFLYATNLKHLANDGEDYGGWMTEIRVTPAP